MARERVTLTSAQTYIIVKPPPTASKNPLNLQVQLVVQTRRGRDRAASSTAFSARSASMGSFAASASAQSSPAKPLLGLPDSPPTSAIAATGPELAPVRSESPTQISTSGSGDEQQQQQQLGAELARTMSLKSSVSAISSRSGTGSAMGVGKRIEPMFNLAVHNVMQPTVVTDAATDTKVAKVSLATFPVVLVRMLIMCQFLKRQVDISGVGVLEPTEVWLPVPGANPLNQSSSGSDDGQSPPTAGTGGRASRPLSMVSFNTPLTPTMSRTSEFTPSKSGGGKRGSMDIKNDIRNFRDSIMNGTNSPDAGGAGTAVAGAPKKFFGKLFRKKDSVDVSNGSGNGGGGGGSGFSTTSSMHRKSISEVTETGLPAPPSPNPEAGRADLPPTAGTRSSMMTTEYTPTFIGHSTFGTAPYVVQRRSSDPTINPDGAVTGLTLPSAGPALSLSASGSLEQVKGTPFPMVPSTRPVGYTWTVRNWAKRNTENWAAHVVAASAAGLDAKMDDDVVFEWVKMKTAPSNSAAALRREVTRNSTLMSPRRPKPRSRTASVIDSPAQSQTSLALPLPTPNRASSSVPPSPNLDAARPSAMRSISARSSPARPSTPLMEDTASTIQTQTEDECDPFPDADRDADAGYDSDPEDSETPWTCSIWIKKTNHRQLIATLTPAPHHPKVIGQLKIPVGLCSIPLCQLTTRSTALPTTDEKRQRQKEATSRIMDQVCLTEEGLKDIICVSAMWLVAREEFGGLGRKKKP